MSKIYKLGEVFSPGGQPTVTYVSRDGRGLEKDLKRALNLPNSFAAVTGPSKSGKTVLCRSLLSNHQFVWIDGGQITALDNIWRKLANILEQPDTITSGTNKSTSFETTADLAAKGKIPLLAEGSGKFGVKDSNVEDHLVSSTRAVDRQGECISHMLRHGIILVIDDFHYLLRSDQIEIMRALKGPVSMGLKVLLLSVSYRAYEALQAEVEITGRFVHVEVPEWSEPELCEIAELGFSALNVKAPKAIVKKLATEAVGSPQLMQYFCWDLCSEREIYGTNLTPARIPSKFDPSNIFERIAKDMGQPIYDRLAAGPQSRTTRIDRPLRDGEAVDIYHAILRAIAATGPKKSLSYDEIRTSLSNILADKVPQKLEVSNALNHISRISASISEDSRPIDWLENDLRLVIADPMFRFFLKWKIARSR